MDEQRMNKLFRTAIRNIHKEWKSKQGLGSFVSRGESALRRIRSEFNYEQATAAAAIVTEKLKAAANMRQLTLTTEVLRSNIPRFSGYKVHVTYQGGAYEEIFIGPRDTFDKVMWLPRYGEYLHLQDNPYTKSRQRMWKSIADFDFEAMVTEIKHRIDNPPVYEDDGEDEIPF